MDDFIGFLAVLVLTALVFFAAMVILGIVVAVIAGLLVLLSPFIVIGFMEGWEERKAENSNPSRVSDPSG